ncbi:MAG: 6-phosphogluconolactonase [Bacteroidota bacterium]|nr:6-phosphogluconolactonase [Bacteroidota bacterium]MDP4232219.1 6-phosphogluconolactonase [Bacteroidota bacterium]MDP4243600.1 6-phosphogluconolactonase [Bacteroidota bacterium]MDP4288748.1 6-phosphogluconolactonase [Bacteroidota bacterium]
MNSIDSMSVFPELRTLSAAAAKELAILAGNAIAARGRFSIALSGGETPRTLYEILARDYRDAIDWQHVHLYWGDERYVPQTDHESNYRMARETLIDRIPVPESNVHPIPTSFANPEDAAIAYAAELESAMPLDLILLGLGEDGHTASLFPGTFDPADRRLMIVTRSPKPPLIRISMTLRAINDARNVFFLVAGEEKQGILEKIVADREGHYPASLVRPKGKLAWFLDRLSSEPRIKN